MTEIQKFAGFRADPKHLAKLRALSFSTGLTTGGVLRALVENAQIGKVEKVEPFATLSTNTNNDGICQDKPVVVA